MCGWMLFSSILSSCIRRLVGIAGLSLCFIGFFAFIPYQAGDRKILMEKVPTMRPSNLVILIKRTHIQGGEYLLGIYDLKVDEVDQTLRRFKLWKEWPFDLSIHSELVRCSYEEPLRLKRYSKSIYVRRLNPGGGVTTSNREDHLVWWAACFPSLAGIDPETLNEKALEMGFSTELIESQEILNSKGR